MMYVETVDEARVEEVYTNLLQLMIDSKVVRAEAIAVTAIFLAVQVVGEVPKSDPLRSFIKDISAYILLYFGGPLEEEEKGLTN